MSSFQVYPPSTNTINVLDSLGIEGQTDEINNTSTFIVGGVDDPGFRSMSISRDGNTWAQTVNDPFVSGTCYSLCLTEEVFIACGFNTGNTVSIGYSYDGYVWTNSDNNPFAGSSGRACAWSPTLRTFVAGGSNLGGTVTVAYSKNLGKSWTVPAAQIFDQGTCFALCWSPSLSLFVAGGHDALSTVSLYYSVDGIAWSLSTNNPFNGGICYGLCWSPSLSLFVAVGDNGINTITIAYSTDGKFWTPSTNNIFTGGSSRCICWSPTLSLFVAGGSDVTGNISLAYSTDAKQWFTNAGREFNTLPCLGVSWGLDRFVAVGANPGGTITCYLSYDGKSWFLPVNQPFTSAPDVAYASSFINKYIPIAGPKGPAGGKTFIIDHPLDPQNKYLIHACMEGPEVGVYYRGSAITTENKSVNVFLPEYASCIATDFTVYVSSKSPFGKVASSSVVGNKFTVFSDQPLCKFDWCVFGKRKNLTSSVEKSQAIIRGEGPYKYL